MFKFITSVKKYLENYFFGNNKNNTKIYNENINTEYPINEDISENLIANKTNGTEDTTSNQIATNPQLENKNEVIPQGYLITTKTIKAGRFDLNGLKRTFIYIFIFINGMAAPLFAQIHTKSNKWQTGEYEALYNIRTVETVNGEINKVVFFISFTGWSRGVRLLVQTDKGLLLVHVGPEWYLTEKSLVFEKGDRIEIKGSRIVFEGEQIIIAAEIMTKGDTIRLRNDQGHAIWSKTGRFRH